jgi:hypothetical protein
MNYLYPLVEMFNDTTSELNVVVKKFVMVILTLILLSAIAVTIGVAIQGAPNIVIAF